MRETLEQNSVTKFTNRVMGNTVFMLVNKQIGYDDTEPSEPFIDGPAFAEELYSWKSQGKNVKVKINSPGGRVVQGWDMIDAIIECGADTMNTGIAYSMGGICLIAGKNRSAYEHSTAMLHAPYNKSGKAVSSAGEAIKNAFRALLDSRTKFTKSEIDEMVDSGKDYFFNAKEMLKKGMIDEIIPSDANLNPPMYASAKELCDFFNKQQNDREMEGKSNFSALWAKLTGKSDESEQIVAYTSMQEEVKTLKASVSSKDVEIIALKAKVAEHENASKTNDAKVKAEVLIASAEKAGKFAGIKAEDRVKLVDNAVANYDTVKIMIDSMPSVKKVAAATVISQEGKDTQMTYDWLAKNNPKELNRIATEDPELFDKLSDEYIKAKAEPKEAK